MSANPKFELTLHQINDIFRLGQLNVPRTATEHLVSYLIGSNQIKRGDIMSPNFDLLTPYSRNFFDPSLSYIDAAVKTKLLTGKNTAETKELSDDLDDLLLIRGFALSDLMDAKMVSGSSEDADNLAWKVACLAMIPDSTAKDDVIRHP